MVSVLSSLPARMVHVLCFALMIVSAALDVGAAPMGVAILANLSHQRVCRMYFYTDSVFVHGLCTCVQLLSMKRSL